MTIFIFMHYSNKVATVTDEEDYSIEGRMSPDLRTPGQTGGVIEEEQFTLPPIQVHKVPERKPIETEDLIYEMLKGRIKKSKVKGTPRYSVRRN